MPTPSGVNYLLKFLMICLIPQLSKARIKSGRSVLCPYVCFMLPYAVDISLLLFSWKPHIGGICVQIYSIFSTTEQELKRICASGVKICSIEVKMCKIISKFVAAIYNNVQFRVGKKEKMSTGHVSVPNSSVTDEMSKSAIELLIYKNRPRNDIYNVRQAKCQSTFSPTNLVLEALCSYLYLKYW